MADMRRRHPEPPPGPPQIQFKPGIAKETLRELAPLLAEEGIDVDNIDVPDLDSLQAAMNRAVERHNMTRFTHRPRCRSTEFVPELVKSNETVGGWLGGGWLSLFGLCRYRRLPLRGGSFLCT